MPQHETAYFIRLLEIRQVVLDVLKEHDGEQCTEADQKSICKNSQRVAIKPIHAIVAHTAQKWDSTECAEQPDTQLMGLVV